MRRNNGSAVGGSVPFLLALGLHVPATSSAQVIASAGESEDAEVTVTARRRDENPQDVPIPLSVVSGKTLEDDGLFRLENLSQILPSTNIQYNGPRQTSIGLRGLGNNPANDALESSVAVYQDNVYLGRASMANVDLADIDTITLLRGTQGALFGKNTTAGVLDISTKLPAAAPEGSVEISGGNYDYTQVRGMWSQPWLDDGLAGRLSFAHTSQGGFVLDRTTGRELNGVDRTAGRAQLLWKPNDHFSLRLIADYGEEHSDAGAFVLYSPGPDAGAVYYAAVAAAGTHVIYDPNYATVTLDSRQHFDVREGGGSAEARWELPRDFQLTSISAYRSWWFMPYSDADYTDLNAIPASGQHVDDNQWSQEFRLTSPSGRELTWVLGTLYFDQHQSNLLYTQYGTDVTAITALRLGNASYENGYVQTAQLLNTRSTALYGEATWKPVQPWEFGIGLRGTHEQKDVNLIRSSTGLSAFVTNPNFDSYASGDLTRSDDTLSALLSASRKFGDDALGYVSLARGEKSGGINPTAPVPGLTVGSLYFKPEVTTDAELGLKSALLGTRLVLNTNLFWMKVRDYQATLLLQPNAGNTFSQILSNVGDVRTRGVEEEVIGSFGGLNLRLAASLNDAIYLSYPNAPCSAEQLAPNLKPGQKVCDLSGQPLVGAPRWIVNPSVTYRHLAIAKMDWIADAGFAWRSTFFGSADDSRLAQVPSYGILNLRWTLEATHGTHWAVSVWSNNVCDKRYVLGGLTVSGPLYNYIATPGLPRTVGATLRVDL